MHSLNYENIQRHVQFNYPQIKIIPFDVNDLIYEERVKLNCFYCGKYSSNWRCPPKIPNNIDYKKVAKEFEKAALVICKIKIDSNNYDDVRTESSVILHKAILSIEEFLYNNNNSIALSYIGGSCKLCKNGCGKEKCNNPYYARIPLEATGVNIIETVKKYGIDIVFPPKDNMLRIGLILW